MKNIIFLILFLFGSVAQAEGTVVVEADFWASPRHGETVVAYEPLAQLMRRVATEPQSRLQLNRPEGEWGELWEQELRAWLISFGLSGDRIDFGRSDAALVTIELQLPKGEEQEGVARMLGVDPVADDEVAIEAPLEPVSAVAEQGETVSQEQE